MKQHLTRAIELVNGFGFALIVGSVVYFILGSVAALVHGEMLDWTFCESAHRLIGVEWCGIEPRTEEPAINHFVHKLLNASIPWFMIFWGFVLTGVSSLLLKMLGFRYTPPGAKRHVPPAQQTATPPSEQA